MKKLLYLFAFVFMFIGLYDVKASTYYTNTKNVNFTKEQYDFVSEMFYDGYQEVMEQADLDKMVELDLIGKPISKKTITSDGLINDNPVNPRSTYVYYAGRTLTIDVVCTTQCLVALTAQWGCTPNIQSWDVIGMRYTSDVVVNYINLASVVGTGYSATYYTSSTQYQNQGNGFGYSVKLGNASNLKISTSMYTEPGGTVYGSYQHAVETVSLATSKLYTIGLGGYGYVFHFTGNAYGKYDGAPGVYTVIS